MNHACSEKVSKLFSFYHKYQAEYLVNSDILRENTLMMYNDAKLKFENNLGICPPCWLAHKNNYSFFNSMKPLYIESLLHISYPDKKIFSPVISLGSPNKFELFFLRLLGYKIIFLSVLLRMKRVRIAIHDCDIVNITSMNFFKNIIRLIEKHRYQNVLLNELI